MSEKENTKDDRWEDFWNGVRYFGNDRLTYFMGDAEALALLEQAPNDIKLKIWEKCRKLGVAWPESVEIDLSSLPPENGPLFKDGGETVATEMVHFACNHIPSLSLLVGVKVARFANGCLKTNDPDVIAAVRSDPRYKIHIFEG